MSHSMGTQPYKIDYDRLFEHGLICNDICVDARDFKKTSPSIDDLVKKTHHLIAIPVLCFAIWDGKKTVDNLLKAYKKAFKENNLGYEYIHTSCPSKTGRPIEKTTSVLDYSQHNHALEVHQIHRNIDYDGYI